MGRAITVAILAAALALAAPFIAHAAGLGKLTVLSPLGAQLNAEIEIVALRAGEEDTLVARIAPLDAFVAAGIEPSAMLATLKFDVERRGNQRFLRVTTAQPVNDPFVELLIELTWSSGRLVREYTFLLDPPEYKSRDTVAARSKPAPAKPEPMKPAPPAEAVKPPPPVEARPIEPAAPVIAPVPTPSPSQAPAETPTPAPIAEAPKPAAEAEKPAAAEAEKPAAEAEKPAAEAGKPAATPGLVSEPEGKTYEVQKGDTLGKIARDNLPPGVSLNQMLIAIYRANQDAFIRDNVNLVRAGRILNIPSAEAVGSMDVEEANRVVRAHHAEFRDYRSRLAAVAAPADATPGQPEAAGRIEPKPAPPAPAGAQDQVRLSKADPQKPSPAARADDAKSRERAQAEAQSRINDLEKTVADLQKLLEIRNQQLNELQQKAGQKPGAAAPAPAPTPAAKAPEKPAPAPTPAPAPAAKAPEKPAAAPAPAPTPAPAPAAKAPEKPAPAPAPSTAPTPAPTPAPAPAAKAPEKPAAPVVKPAPKAAPPPERGLLDDVLDFLQDPMGMLALAILVLGLGGYAAWMWRKKKRAHAKFHDSVMGAAAAGAAAGASMTEPSLGAATPPPSASTGSSTQPPAAVAAEEVDPIAEADVYMAYGRDAQAEEILKEALAKDDKRIPVHAKLLEIYAKRKDPKAFEQTALKLKNLTSGAGPEWDKAASLGHSIDPQNGLYAGAAAAGAAAAAAAAPAEPSAPAPTLDFDIGGAAQASASAPDLTLDAAPKAAAPDTGLDFDVSGVSPEKKDVGSDETIVVRPTADQAGSGLDFNLDLGSEQKAEAPAAPPAAPAAPAEADAGLSFDLNLDLGSDKKAEAPAAPDLSTISLDLGSAAAAPAAGGADPKWQEIATKLDLAKAYEEMGDKDGARELLNEVMKDGDAAQKGTAQQLLAKLG